MWRGWTTAMIGSVVAMNGAEQPRDSHARRRVAQLCVRLALESAGLATQGPMRDLAMRIAGAIRTGLAPEELDDELDKLEDLLLRAGFPAGLSAARAGYTELPGVGDGHPVLEVLACPADTCSRLEPPTEAGREPACHVLGGSLRRVRLRP
jgi:hypothetical protein